MNYKSAVFASPEKTYEEGNLGYLTSNDSLHAGSSLTANRLELVRRAFRDTGLTSSFRILDKDGKRTNDDELEIVCDLLAPYDPYKRPHIDSFYFGKPSITIFPPHNKILELESYRNNVAEPNELRSANIDPVLRATILLYARSFVVIRHDNPDGTIKKELLRGFTKIK